MDPTFLLLIVALGIFIVFQVFQGRKRKRETEDRQSKFVVGVEIMTNYGLYGTILSMDEETNVVEIESTPGTVLRIHRQTILKVADYAVVPDDADTEASATDDLDAEIDDDATRSPLFSDGTTPGAPAYGERVGDDVRPRDEGSVESGDKRTGKPASSTDE